MNTTYSYDSLSRLLSVLHQAGGSTIDGAIYTYDNAGNRLSKLNELNGVTENYTYDPTYKLTQVQQITNGTPSISESYSYDLVGNRLSSLDVASYTYNSSNELTASSDGYSYTYDNNGNTLTKALDTNTTAFSWDFDNRLTQVTLPGNGGAVTFKYDPFGRRIQKVSSAGTTNYVYDRANAVAEVDGSGGVLARYSQGAEIDEPLFQLRSTANFYEADGLGSITSLSNAAAQLSNHYTYGAFGNLINSTESVANPVRYTGREFESDTNLSFYRARFYDENLGRFLNEDPIRFSAGANFYPYTLNNPVRWTDPSGLEVQECRRPVHAPGAHDVPHTFLYSSDTGTGYGLGPKNGFGWLSPLSKVPGSIENDYPYDSNGKLKPEYECQTISKDKCVEKCVNDKGRGKAPPYQLGTYQCDTWANDVENACEKECGK